MRRIILVASLFLSGIACADLFEQGALTFSPDTKQVIVSTIPTSPTQILTRDSYIRRNFIVNPSTVAAVCISSFSASVAVSTTTSPAAILPNTTFSPDGPSATWWGPLFGILCQLNPVAGPNQSVQISVIRTK